MRTFLQRLSADQRVRFLAVGATNTVVGYGLYAALTIWVFATAPFGYLASLIISYACAVTLAFVLYRRFVFVVTGRVAGDFVRFLSVYAVSIGINILALPLLVEVLTVPALVAQAVILVVTTIVSYVGHKLFSFRRDGSAAVQPPSA